MQGRNPPQNCSQAFSKEGDQIFTNRTYTAEQTRANCLSGDVEEEIRCVYVRIFSENRLATVVVSTGVTWFLGMHEYLTCWVFLLVFLCLVQQQTPQQ